MAAIENPYTHILGHSSGRLLLSRPAYPLNYDVVIEACAKHKVVLEINAHPRRLDLDWQWISLAQEKNVMLSINPDAHSIDGIDDVFYGIRSAQKGMLRKQHNLSSLPLSEFKTYITSLKP
jgi:DNA polymerase (family 10)